MSNLICKFELCCVKYNQVNVEVWAHYACRFIHFMNSIFKSRNTRSRNSKAQISILKTPKISNYASYSIKNRSCERLRLEFKRWLCFRCGAWSRRRYWWRKVRSYGGRQFWRRTRGECLPEVGSEVGVERKLTWVSSFLFSADRATTWWWSWRRRGPLHETRLTSRTLTSGTRARPLLRRRATTRPPPPKPSGRHSSLRRRLRTGCRRWTDLWSTGWETCSMSTCQTPTPSWDRWPSSRWANY